MLQRITEREREGDGNRLVCISEGQGYHIKILQPWPNILWRQSDINIFGGKGSDALNDFCKGQFM